MNRWFTAQAMRGFTLIELLLVVVLVATVMGAVGGSLSMGDGSESYAQRLVEDLDRRARLHAQRGTAVWLALSPDGQRLQIVEHGTEEKLGSVRLPSPFQLILEVEDGRGSVGRTRVVRQRLFVGRGARSAAAVWTLASPETRLTWCVGPTGHPEARTP